MSLHNWKIYKQAFRHRPLKTKNGASTICKARLLLRILRQLRRLALRKPFPESTRATVTFRYLPGYHEKRLEDEEKASRAINLKTIVMCKTKSNLLIPLDWCRPEPGQQGSHAIYCCRCSRLMEDWVSPTAWTSTTSPAYCLTLPSRQT